MIFWVQLRETWGRTERVPIDPVSAAVQVCASSHLLVAFAFDSHGYAAAGSGADESVAAELVAGEHVRPVFFAPLAVVSSTPQLYAPAPVASGAVAGVAVRGLCAVFRIAWLVPVVGEVSALLVFAGLLVACAAGFSVAQLPAFAAGFPELSFAVAVVGSQSARCVPVVGEVVAPPVFAGLLVACAAGLSVVQLPAFAAGFPEPSCAVAGVEGQCARFVPVPDEVAAHGVAAVGGTALMRVQDRVTAWKALEFFPTTRYACGNLFPSQPDR